MKCKAEKNEIINDYKEKIQEKNKEISDSKATSARILDNRLKEKDINIRTLEKRCERELKDRLSDKDVIIKENDKLIG